VKIGQEHYREEDDGSFTQTETTFHDLVAFRKTAERAHQRFAKGDKFIAEGYTHQYDRTDENGQTVKARSSSRRRSATTSPAPATRSTAPPHPEPTRWMPDRGRRTVHDAPPRVRGCRAVGTVKRIMVDELPDTATRPGDGGGRVR
jgi:single-stranded DNA-binding protein